MTASEFTLVVGYCLLLAGIITRHLFLNTHKQPKAQIQRAQERLDVVLTLNKTEGREYNDNQNQ